MTPLSLFADVDIHVTATKVGYTSFGVVACSAGLRRQGSLRLPGVHGPLLLSSCASLVCYFDKATSNIIIAKERILEHNLLMFNF